MPTYEELYCLLVPLEGMKIILPRETVIEVINRGTLTDTGQGPSWLLGWRQWNGAPLPVVSLEALAGFKHAPPGPKSRLIVVQALSGVLSPPQFALMTLGYPYLLRTTDSILKPHEDHSALKGFLCRIHLGGENPLIPDFDAIEAELSAWSPAAV
ncbi:MAG: chemotaxis protein CheW [Gammaproteobacteria bacterium]